MCVLIKLLPLLLLELLFNLYNVPTFVLALATPGTNTRSKPGDTQQSAQM